MPCFGDAEIYRDPDYEEDCWDCEDSTECKKKIDEDKKNAKRK